MVSFFPTERASTTRLRQSVTGKNCFSYSIGQLKVRERNTPYLKDCKDWADDSDDLLAWDATLPITFGRGLNGVSS
jgi:hypothetical protein